MTITQTVDIPENRRISLKVPAEVPVGPVILTLTPKDDVTTKEQKKEREFGCAKGQFWIADDFDAPLEDFKDYM